MNKYFIASLVGLSFSAMASASTVNLSSSYWVQYGDAQSYSLPIAGLYVDSSPGKINDFIVVATSPNGIATNPSGMDNAYNTPNSSADTFFYTNATTSRGTTGTVANNGVNTWDASLAAMEGFLKGEQMAIFFNNNQVNSGTDSSLQSLASWARIWITDTAGALVTNPGINNGSGYFYLTNNLGKYDLVSMGGGGTFMGNVTNFSSTVANPTAGTAASTDYVLSGGQICTITISGIPTPVPCSTPGASAPINHNLGANEAAYALIFPELNALMNGLFSTLSAETLQSYTLHADVRLGCGFKPVMQNAKGGYEYNYTATNEAWGMSCMYDNTYGNGLNNGYEQIFIGTATFVPEPASLALLGLGLAGLGFSRRRKA